MGSLNDKKSFISPTGKELFGGERSLFGQTEDDDKHFLRSVTFRFPDFEVSQQQIKFYFCFSLFSRSEELC
jgi:hypothetical protein